jgi:hypothetical protein
MHSGWPIVNRLGTALRDGVLFLVGHRCIALGEWPDQGVVEAVVATVTELGGQQVPGKDFPLAFDIENLYFRVQGRRVRLCIEEYGSVTFWGPRTLVAELSKRVAQKLAASCAQSTA